MSAGGWRRAAVPLLALVATQVVQAGEDVPRAAEIRAPAPTADAPVEATSSPWWSVPEALRPFGVESWWDVVRFEPWTGAIGLTFDDQEQRIRAPGSADQRYSSRLLNESFSIRNDGFVIIDPRLLTGSVALGSSFDQEWQNALGVALTRHGTLVDYAIDITALPQSPYNVNVFANQNQATYVLPSGTTTHSDILNRGITVRLRENSILRDKEILPYFTSNLRAHQQYDKQTTTTAGQSFRQDDRRDLMAFDFQNGTETSDLNFQYQFTNLDNFAYQDGSYHSQSTNVLYSVDFGPTLNWRSDSRLNYYSRTGKTSLSDLSTLEANEFLTVDHNAELSSNYNYQLIRQDTPVGVSTTQSAGAQVQRQFYRNFSGTAGVNGLYSSLPGGTISAAGVSGNMSYSHALPWQGQLTANAGGGYLVTKTRVAAGLVQVTDASYQVPPAIGAGASILLKDRNIQVPTIIVIVLKGGTRAAAIVDVDYTVRVDGDQTSIVPLATSAVMQPGDPLNISYSYEVAPDSKFQTVSNSASLAGDWAWFGFSASHDQSDQTPLGGSDATLLVNERRDTGLVYVRGVWERWQARASAGLVRYDSDRLAYRETRLSQFVSYVPFLDLQINLAGDEYRTEYELPVHTTTGNSVRLDLQWNYGAWLTTAYAARRSYRDTQQASETIFEAGLRTRRSWTKLDLSVATSVQQRKRGNVESINGILHIGLVRRF